MIKVEDLKANTEYTGVHPLKFALWLAMASMTMFFMGLTSALVIKRGDYQVWEDFKLPITFLFSTLAVISVSVLLHVSLLKYRAKEFKSFRILLGFGLVMAAVFLILQANALHSLDLMGKAMTGNISGSFLHMLTYVHGAHIAIAILISGLFFFFSWKARKNLQFEGGNKIDPQRQLHLELLVSFWHYIDAVWIYLYIFLYFNYK